MPEDTNSNADKIRKVLYNEVTLVISLASIAIGIVLFITRPDASMQKDIALLQQSVSRMSSNELVHIQAKLDEQDKRLSAIEKIQERILTILEK
jgi:hypothetical protein